MAHLKIAVNTRMLIADKLDGIGYFAYHTLKKIAQSHPEVQFFFIFDRPYDPSFIFSENITPIVLYPSATHPLLTYLWYQVRLNSIVKKIKPDLFLSPDGIIPLHCSSKRLPVIHDLNFYHYPKDLKFLSSKFYNFYFPRFAREATRIVTVSEYSKADLVQAYGIEPEKIDVVGNGVSAVFKPLDEETREQTRKKFSDTKEYFIFIGSIHPRKNLVRLLRAFDVFKKQSGSDMKLVIVGQKFWGNKELEAVMNVLAYKEDIVFTGRVNEEDLAYLLGSAFSLIHPSYFEGFCVPLVEAMYSEVPILCSRTTALPEIAGQAALYFDPFDSADMTNAMLKMHSNAALQKELVEQGRKQRAQFSWNQSAKKLWTSIEKTLAQ